MGDTIYSITKQQAKNSVQCRWRKLMFMYCLIISIIISVVFVSLCISDSFTHFSDGKPFFWIELYILFPLLICVFYALTIYNGVCYRRVISVSEQCNVYRVKLDQPKDSWFYRWAVRYTVQFDSGHGTICRNTSRMFSSYRIMLMYMSMEYYNNKEVYLIYDVGWDRVYVIDIVDVLQLEPKA